jgi:hypothetical protein
MAYVYKTISGSDESTLMIRNENFVNKPFYASMLLTNTHATDSVNVDLYLVTFDIEPKDEKYFIQSEEEIEDQYGVFGHSPDGLGDVTDRTITETVYYILKKVTLPIGASLKLEKEDIMFKISDYELRIQLSAGDSDVDVLIDLTNNDFTDNEYIY